MIEIEILAVGKTKDSPLQKLLEDYEKRLRGKIRILWRYYKKDEDLLDDARSRGYVIALDPKGLSLDTETLAGWIQKKLEAAKGSLTFVIGGPEGLPPGLSPKAFLSLSPLTLTHQMVRLLFIEQIYRCYTIWTGHPYHK